MIYNNSLYGNYRTRKFTDRYSTFEEFRDAFNNCKIPVKDVIDPKNIETIYYLLYAKYGNSHIASSDEKQFEYKMFSIIYEFGPIWQKKIEVQDKLMNLSEEELRTGSKQIVNHAANPETLPKSTDLEELNYINDQNTVNYKKSKLDAYAILTSLLEANITSEFIVRFKPLFLTIVNPELPLWYEEEDDEDGGNY